MTLTVNDIVGGSGRKKVYKGLRFVYKCNDFSVECEGKYERLDAKKILPFEEFNRDKVSGKRVIGKKVGYNNGTLKHFEAIQNDKGKYVASDISVNPSNVEKVILDTRTGDVKRKSTSKGLRFIKEVSIQAMNAWHIEDTYNIFTDVDSDMMLRVYERLIEHGLVGVYKFNPYGTEYNGFLIPQRVNGGHFRLLLRVARVKIDKPNISPTMVIADAQVREREKTRIDEIGTMSALEEV